MSTLYRYQERLIGQIIWKTWSWKPMEIQLGRVCSQVLSLAIPVMLNTKANPKTVLLFIVLKTEVLGLLLFPPSTLPIPPPFCFHLTCSLLWITSRDWCTKSRDQMYQMPWCCRESMRLVICEGEVGVMCHYLLVFWEVWVLNGNRKASLMAVLRLGWKPHHVLRHSSFRGVAHEWVELLHRKSSTGNKVAKTSRGLTNSVSFTSVQIKIHCLELHTNVCT